MKSHDFPVARLFRAAYISHPEKNLKKTNPPDGQTPWRKNTKKIGKRATIEVEHLREIYFGRTDRIHWGPISFESRFFVLFCFFPLPPNIFSYTNLKATGVAVGLG